MINGTIFLLITVLGWGIMYPASKIAVDAGIDGYYLATIRYVLGSMLLAGLLLFTESIRAFRYEGNFIKLWIYGTIGFAGLNIFTFVGISFSNAEHATIILALLPMIGIFLNWFLDGVHPALHTLIFAMISFVGIVLVITKLEFDGSLNESLLGDILLLMGTASWVVYTYYIRQFPQFSALRVTVLSSIPGTISIVFITFILTMLNISTPPTINSIESVTIPLLILVLTTSVIVTWNAGIKRLGIVNGILFVNLVPIITFTIGYLNGNLITKIEIIGASLTIMALIANNILSRKYTR